MPGIYRSTFNDGKKEPIFFNPPKLGDPPPTRELIAAFYKSLILL